MNNKYTKEFMILPSVCDDSGALSVPGTFELFMDAATEHACALGCGLDALAPRGLFWLTVRTRVRFFRRPKMLERVTISTWPEPPGKLRTNRDYTIEQGGEPLCAGKTEWTVLDQRSGRLHPMADVFAPDFDFWPQAVWEEPFTHMPDAPMEEFSRYTVRPTDIDLGGHMNNAAYIRAIAGAFPCKVWRDMAVRELEIAFRAPCYEGDTLILQRRKDGDTTALRAALPDGKTIVLARIVQD